MIMRLPAQARQHLHHRHAKERLQAVEHMLADINRAMYWCQAFSCFFREGEGSLSREPGMSTRLPAQARQQLQQPAQKMEAIAGRHGNEQCALAGRVPPFSGREMDIVAWELGLIRWLPA